KISRGHIFASRALATSDCLGASGRVPAVKPERPLSVQSRDLAGSPGNGRNAPIAATYVLGSERYRHSAAIRLSYSITSSARARIAGGTVRPSALAVLRLMTSSNLV